MIIKVFLQKVNNKRINIYINKESQEFNQLSC